MLKPIFKMTRVLNHSATGAKARRYRERRKISGQQVAKLMGLDQTIVSKLESGKRNWSTEDRDFERYVEAVDTIYAEPTENKQQKETP